MSLQKQNMRSTYTRPQEPAWQEAAEDISRSRMWLTPLRRSRIPISQSRKEQACVTAGGKVIDTDTEALQKKLESAKKAAAAKKEAETADSEATVEQQIQETEEEPKKEYVYPPLSLLKRGGRNSGGYSEQDTGRQCEAAADAPEFWRWRYRDEYQLRPFCYPL